MNDVERSVTEQRKVQALETIASQLTHLSSMSVAIHEELQRLTTIQQVKG